MRRSRSGTAMIEFVFLGIPVIFVTMSIIEASIAMWQFHSMAFAVAVATRYAATHGAGCSLNGNTCSITVGAVTTMLSNQGPALNTAKLNATLTTNSATKTCNPINTCLSSTTQFPSAADNAVGLDVKIAVTYPVFNPLAMFWPGAGTVSSPNVTLGATSKQRILF